MFHSLMPMTRIHAKQLSLALSVMLTGMLGAAVFLWGVQYKCSLYQPEQHPRMAAVPKLLSERERTVAAQTTAVLRAPLPQALFFAARVLLPAAFRNVRPQMEWFHVEEWNGSATNSAGCLIHFPFRPPPKVAL